MSDRVLTIRDAVSLATIIRGLEGKAGVARLMDNGDVLVGTARSIGDDRGNFLGRGEDVRDAFLRVTLDSGWEAFWPIAELIPQVGESFVTNYER